MSLPNGSSSGESDAAEYKNKSVALTPTRPPYSPQYSQSTQMILNSIRAKDARLAAGSLSVKPVAHQSTIKTVKEEAVEEARKRLLQTIRPSAVMAFPTQTSPPPPPQRESLPLPRPQPSITTPGPNLNVARALSAPRSRVLLPTQAQESPQPAAAPCPQRPALRTQPDGNKPFKLTIKPISRGGRRASAKEVISGLGDSSDGETRQPRTQTTKSGRQVQRPAQFIPQQESRKKAMTKRTEAQAMCQLCKRLAFTDDNQIVFCDCCNDSWHQKCSNPVIPVQVVNSDVPWFCPKCQALKQPYIGPADGLVPWTDRPAEEKRAYLSTVPQSTLVSLVMKSLSQHPDLPIFPAMEDVEPIEAVRGVRVSPGRSKSAINTHSSFLKRHGKNALNKDVELDLNLMPELEPNLKWPKHGGLYQELPPEKDDKFLEDEDDYEAFSVIKYDKFGNKTWENGVSIEAPGRKLRS